MIHLALVGLGHPLSELYLPKKELSNRLFEFRGSLNNPFLNQTGRTGVFGKASATISAVSIALQISQTKIFSFVPTSQADYQIPSHV